MHTGVKKKMIPRMQNTDNIHMLHTVLIEHVLGHVAHLQHVHGEVLERQGCWRGWCISKLSWRRAEEIFQPQLQCMATPAIIAARSPPDDVAHRLCRRA